VSTAKAAFEGESLIAVSWSGNYEQVFRETIIKPFNDKYNTKAETVGGWDQIVSQIKAAPADNPPFDVTVAEEYISSSGLAENLYMKTDRSKIPNLDAVYPWFYETRPDKAKDYGIPFGGGTCMLLMRKNLNIAPDSWGLLWDERLAGKTTADSAAWWWTLSVPAVMEQTSPGLDEMYDMKTAEPLFQQLDKLKVAKWFKDGAEQANLLNQGEADAAMSYSSDAYTFMTQSPDEYLVAVPKEGVSAWADWYFKVRGTKHNDLADLFMNYMLEKETQDRFLSQSLIFMARKDVTVPAHWNGYPKSNEDYHKMFQIITMDGWDKINANYQAYDDRMKQTIAKTSG
uniref:ABC transporter substrate-binding protein n=1 Tax=Aestuariivirga sp. TaxID=2650926 RepID=UPI0035B4EB43